MTMEEFQSTLAEERPPASLPPLLRALWWDAHGDFTQAHEIAQDESLGQDAAWVHAYLHRKEGDESNAGYWYRRARQPHAHVPVDEEWRQITSVFLQRHQA